MTRILDGESVSRRDSPGQSGDKEDGMRVIRLLPLGFVVAAGVVLLGCGDSGSAPATEATSSDLMAILQALQQAGSLRARIKVL